MSNNNESATVLFPKKISPTKQGCSSANLSCLAACVRRAVGWSRLIAGESRSHGRCPASQRMQCNAGREDHEASSLSSCAALPVAKLPRIMHGNGRPAAFLGWYGGRGHVACRGAREREPVPVCQHAPWCVVCARVDPLSVLYALGAASSRDPSTKRPSMH